MAGRTSTQRKMEPSRTTPSSGAGKGGAGRIGSHALAHQYSIIAASLKELEKQRAFGRSTLGIEVQETFRVGVVFVSTEVLNSYREDLLNPDCSEKYLLIEQEFGSKWQAVLSATGVLAASMLGLLLAVQGLGVFPAWLITVALAVPFAVYWVQAPHRALKRRYAFAGVVAAEIGRRKGSHPPIDSFTSGSPLIQQLFVTEGTAFSLHPVPDSAWLC